VATINPLTTLQGDTMKPAKICRSLGLLLVVTIPLVVLPITGSACAEDPTPSGCSAAAGASGSDLASKWGGVYNPFSRGCSGDVLTVYEAKFTWGDCKTVKIRVIAASDTELAFEVDPNAKCSLSGWIVALTALPPDGRAVDVRAYQSLQSYQLKGHQVFCAYTRRMPN
jgi:hypothetical protein